MSFAALASSVLICTAVPQGLDATPRTTTVAVGQSANDEQQNIARAAQGILADPSSAQPMNYIFVVQFLWERGDREQAAFWYYLWQMRTRPWAQAGMPQIAQLRGALTETWGRPVNEWLGSDVDARTALAERAISYERTLPLSPDRPNGVSAERWMELVVTQRQTYEAQFREFLTMPQFHGDAHREARLANGLYVGPWQSPGAPLPDSWR